MASEKPNRNLSPWRKHHESEAGRLEVAMHSFIIRIWLEEMAYGAGSSKWRGSITHVPSGSQQYIQDLDSISAFIAGYLQQMGVKFSLFYRFRIWLIQHWLSARRKL
jgi:hypothetical protein